MHDKLAILVCENLRREAAEVLCTEEFGDVVIVPVAARCHKTGAVSPEIEARIEECQATSGEVEVLGCDALASSAGGDSTCCTRSATCFELVLNRSVVQSYLDSGAYLVTPSWLAGWRTVLAEWQFDQPGARAFFAECATHVLLLDTGVDPESDAHLEAFADYVGLPPQSLTVGLTHLRERVLALVLSWRLRRAEAAREPVLAQTGQVLADHAMAFDVLSQMSGLAEEQQVVDRILDLFYTLCAPARVVYLPFTNGTLGPARVCPAEGTITSEELVGLVPPDLERSAAALYDTDGFGLRLDGEEGVLGFLHVSHVAFPEHRNEYLNLGLAIRRVMALAVENARHVEALEEARSELDRFFDLVPDMVCVASTDGFFKRLNPAWERVLGFTLQELLSRPFSEYIHPDDLTSTMAEVEKQTRGEPTHNFTNRYQCKDGSYKWLEWVAVPSPDGTALFAAARDTTARRRAEAELRQQQKLAAIGTLARGMAHEINNPIMGMMSYAQLIQSQLEDANPLRGYAGEIIQEGERVASIVRSLLNASQEQIEVGRLVHLKDIVNATLLLIEASLKLDRIALTVDVAEDLPYVRCRSRQLQHILLALLSNAREALNMRYPESHADKVIILTACRTGGHRENGIGDSAMPTPPLDSPCWLRLTVEDHGGGIAPDITDRIFEPFFTTKSRSKHSGLSLATSQALLREDGGTLAVESEPGRYTRFHLDLPMEDERT